MALNKFMSLLLSFLVLVITLLLFKVLLTFRPSWFPSSDLNFHTVGKKDFALSELNQDNDIVVIPETFLPLLPSCLVPKVVIFNQNMHYLFGELFDLGPRICFACIFIAQYCWSTDRFVLTMLINLDLLPIHLLIVFIES